jgi:hypothetical protein
MTTFFDGTVPVLPFHPTGMVGTVQSDGQRPQVAALACEPDGRVICLSLVGPATSVSSALAKLMDPNGRLFFEPNEGIAWAEPRILQRETGIAYRELSVHLRGTLAAHGLCLPLSAHLGDGLVHPPVIPQEHPPAEAANRDPAQTEPSATLLDSFTRLRAALAQARPRYLFGNWSETTPHQRTFLGVLRGLRALFLNVPPGAEPGMVTAMQQWAEALWHAGLAHDLITPLPAVGIRAWRVAGDLARWSDLISNGVRERWLPCPVSPHDVF